MDRNRLLKMIVILASIVVIAGSISRLLHRDSLTLTDYAKLHPTAPPETVEPPEASVSSPMQASDASGEQAGPETAASQPADGTGPDPSKEADGAGSSMPSRDPDPDEAQPTGAMLNGSSMAEQRICLTEDFYYEPLSDKLRRYITGISYPDPQDGAEDGSDAPEIGLDDLRYVHILYIDYEGVSKQGELICNEYIAQDLTEIFYELYRSEYRLESVLLIDEYDGDDNASMEANNTSCFNYRPVTNNQNLSMHAYGLAVDINPLYNPYVAFRKDGSQEILPASGQPYADRGESFPYKIDEDDLCYKLFTQHGFIWGGNWNNLKDYQHFQKSKP